MANVSSINGNKIAVGIGGIIGKAVTVDNQVWGGTQVPLTLNEGYFNSDGSISAHGATRLECYTDPISVSDGEVLRVSFTSPDGNNLSMWCGLMEYTVDGAKAERITLIDGSMPSFEVEYVALKDVESVAFCFRSYGYQDRFIVRRMTPLHNTARSNLNGNGVGHLMMREANGGYIVDGGSNYIGMPSPVSVESNELYTVFVGYSDNRGCDIYVRHIDSSGTIIKTDHFGVTANRLMAATFKTDSACTSVYAYCYNRNGLTLDDSAFITINKGVRHLAPSDSSVDGRLSLLEDAVGSEIKFTTTAGYYSSTGEINDATVSQGEVYTNLIPVEYSSMRFELTHDAAHVMWVACAMFDARKQFMSRYSFPLNNTIEVYGLSGTIDASQLDGVGYVSLCWRTYSDSTMRIFGMVDTVMASENSRVVSGYENPFIDKPVYDHLFVSSDPITVPHESIHHVRLSGRLGYKVIEANIAKTSDGVFVVNHLQGYKFGRYFTHVDGVTDISDTPISSVTWDWIVDNVRYASTIARYRTRPCRLEEFLSECRKVGVIPFVTSSNMDAVKIVDEYMGRDNYIAYGGNRTKLPTAVIYHWVGKTTKQGVIDYCESIGRPFIYGMSNPTEFTDEQLMEIVSELHERGYWIGCSYKDASWYKYAAMGFDFNGSQYQCNRIDHPDVINATSVVDFSAFTVDGGEQTDSGLYFANEGSIAPAVESVPNGVYVADVEVNFNGSITVPAIGEMAGGTYESDGKSPWFESVPVIGSNPIATIAVGAGTTIRDISYLVGRA